MALSHTDASSPSAPYRSPPSPQSVRHRIVACLSVCFILFMLLPPPHQHRNTLLVPPRTHTLTTTTTHHHPPLKFCADQPTRSFTVHLGGVLRFAFSMASAPPPFLARRGASRPHFACSPRRRRSSRTAMWAGIFIAGSVLYALLFLLVVASGLWYIWRSNRGCHLSVEHTFHWFLMLFCISTLLPTNQSTNQP